MFVRVIRVRTILWHFGHRLLLISSIWYGVPAAFQSTGYILPCLPEDSRALSFFLRLLVRLPFGVFTCYRHCVLRAIHSVLVLYDCK